MTAIASSRYRTQDMEIPFDLGVVCLWATFGLALTALAIGCGFGADIASALAMAG